MSKNRALRSKWWLVGLLKLNCKSAKVSNFATNIHQGLNECQILVTYRRQNSEHFIYYKLV